MFIDVAKGFGISLVLLFHSRDVPYGHYLSAFYMQAFFMLSGYVDKPGGGFWRYLAKRARGLLIPYLGFNVFLLSVRISMDLITSRFEFAEYGAIVVGFLYSRYCLYPMGVEPNHYFLMNFNSPLWFLTALLVSSALFYGIMNRFRDNPLGLAISCGGLLFLALAGSAFPILLPWSLDTAPMGAMFMIVGSILARGRYFEKRPGFWHRLGLVGAGGIYLMLCRSNPNINMFSRDYGNHGVWSAFLFGGIGMIGSVWLVWISKGIADTGIGKVCAFLGRQTIWILCLHLLVFELMDRIALHGMGIESGTIRRDWIYLGLRIAAALAICSTAAVAFRRFRADRALA